MKKIDMEIYLIVFLLASLLINAFQFYERWHHEIPRAAYVSWVGVDKRGRCVTGQDFLNYDPDSRADILISIRATEFFEGVENVVLVNKWPIKNDLAGPPEVKMIKAKNKEKIKK